MKNAISLLLVGLALAGCAHEDSEPRTPKAIQPAAPDVSGDAARLRTERRQVEAVRDAAIALSAEKSSDEIAYDDIHQLLHIEGLKRCAGRTMKLSEGPVLYCRLNNAEGLIRPGDYEKLMARRISSKPNP